MMLEDQVRALYDAVDSLADEIRRGVSPPPRTKADVEREAMTARAVTFYDALTSFVSAERGGYATFSWDNDGQCFVVRGFDTATCGTEMTEMSSASLGLALDVVMATRASIAEADEKRFQAEVAANVANGKRQLAEYKAACEARAAADEDEIPF